MKSVRKTQRNFALTCGYKLGQEIGQLKQIYELMAQEESGECVFNIFRSHYSQHINACMECEKAKLNLKA